MTTALLAALTELVGAVKIDPEPQEVAWTTPLDVDTEHATYERQAIADYFGMATRAAQVLAAFRAPFRGRSTPVNAWWGSFDLAVSLFSGDPAEPPSDDFIMRNAMDAQEVAVGWWPGDPKHDGAAFYAYAHPGPGGLRRSRPRRRRSALGRRPRRVRARVGGRGRGRGSARARRLLRPLGLPARLRHLRLGPTAGRQRRRQPAAGRLISLG